MTKPPAVAVLKTTRDDIRLHQKYQAGLQGLIAEEGSVAPTARGVEFPLQHPQIEIGREPSNDLIVEISVVSRFHAIIRRVQGEFELIDLNSLHGTYVNGQRLEGPRGAQPRRILVDDDVIGLASPIECFRFLLPVLPGAGGLDQIPTERELQVLRLAAVGKTSKQIGLALNISAETVKTHIRNVCQKLDASDRTDAVFKASRRGLI